MADPVAAPVTVDPRRARAQAAQIAPPAEQSQDTTTTTSEGMEDVQQATVASEDAPPPSAAVPEVSTAVDVSPLPPSTTDSPLPPSASEAAPASTEADSTPIDTSSEVKTEDADASTGGDDSAARSSSEAARNAEMEAAIAATLAMETEQQPDGEGEAKGDEDGTPLYAGNGTADVPAAVATPPLASSSSSKPKQQQQSALSRFAQLTARVERDPLDGEAQLALLQDAVQKGDLERTREVYEKFLTVFPDAVSLQLSSPEALSPFFVFPFSPYFVPSSSCNTPPSSLPLFFRDSRYRTLVSRAARTY
jgi:hypothetical protein